MVIYGCAIYLLDGWERMRLFQHNNHDQRGMIGHHQRGDSSTKRSITFGAPLTWVLILFLLFVSINPLVEAEPQLDMDLGESAASFLGENGRDRYQ